MSIGAVSAYGAMRAVSFQPYVYNTNTVSAVSMNKLSRISDDVLDKKIDYSDLTDESLNVNPLKKGQILDFQGMLAMQMQRGQNHAARIMRPMGAQVSQGAEEAVMQKPAEAAARYDAAGTGKAETPDRVRVERNAEAADAGSGNISYQMQQALQAYGMFMTA